MSEWISVKDRLPEKEIDVLGSADDPRIMLTVRYSGSIWYPNHFCEEGIIDGITHWMHLPELPKENQ